MGLLALVLGWRSDAWPGPGMLSCSEPRLVLWPVSSLAARTRDQESGWGYLPCRISISLLVFEICGQGPDHPRIPTQKSLCGQIASYL